MHPSHPQSQKYTLNIWKEKVVNCTEIYNPDSRAAYFLAYFTFCSSGTWCSTVTSPEVKRGQLIQRLHLYCLFQVAFWLLLGSGLTVIFIPRLQVYISKSLTTYSPQTPHGVYYLQGNQVHDRHGFNCFISNELSVLHLQSKDKLVINPQTKQKNKVKS